MAMLGRVIGKDFFTFMIFTVLFNIWNIALCFFILHFVSFCTFPTFQLYTVGCTVRSPLAVGRQQVRAYARSCFKTRPKKPRTKIEVSTPIRQ